MKVICIKSLAGTLRYFANLTKDQVYDIHTIEYYDDDVPYKKFIYYLKDDHGTEIYCEKGGLKRSHILFEEYFTSFDEVRANKIDLLIN